jgi:hypothetical protein
MNQFIAAKPKSSEPPPSPGAPQALEQGRPADNHVARVRRAPRKRRARDVDVIETLVAFLEQLPKAQAKRIMKLVMRML